MAFNRIVILGGGPVGLLSAIEAKKHFKWVTIIEKRRAYTRTNVPVLQADVKDHLRRVGVAEKLGLDKANATPFSRIEEALWEKARSKGVTMQRGFVAVAVGGRGVKSDGTYKSMVLTIMPWDEQAKAVDGTAAARHLEVDLLVVCTGGGAMNDEVMKSLGFSWTALKAKNYAAFGIFEQANAYTYDPHDNSGLPVFDRQLREDLLPNVLPVATGRTGISTRDHNYLLATLGGCTRAEYKVLSGSTTKLKTLLTGVGRTMQGTVLSQIKEVDKNVALFKIELKMANQLYSPRYPAVLVGDAAITPHPETGSGLVTAFKGFEELRKLFIALEKTHRSEDYRQHFLSFDQSYHLAVAEKALKGTWSILENLVKTAERVQVDLGQEIHKSKNGGAKEVMYELAEEIERIVGELKAEMGDAEKLVKVLKGEPIPIDPSLSVDRLWIRIAATYKRLKRTTGDLDFLSERLETIGARLAQ